MKIKHLELKSSNLLEQKHFYSSILGFSILEEQEDFVSFQVGDSILTFNSSDSFTPYHFALNIPSFKEKEALKWLSVRVDIIKDGANEIQYFDFWDAHAIYFYDADHNIVEFIARKTLNKQENQVFGINSVLNISEIGVPTKDIKQVFAALNETMGLEMYSGNLESFCAGGDEEGLFIIINKEIKKEWYPTQDKPISSAFKIKCGMGEKVYEFEFKEEVLKRIEQ